MIKIAFVLPLWGYGGTEKVMAMVADHIDKSQFEVEFIVLNENKRGGYRPNDSHIRIINLNIERVANSILKLRKCLLQEKPDIIICSLSHLNLYLAFFKKLKFIGRGKLVLRESTILSVSAKVYGSPGWMKHLIHRCYPAAAHIICQSESMRNDMVNNYKLPAKKMTVINNPVDIERINTLKDEFIPPYKDSAKNVLAIGRMTPDKGFDLLLEAISMIKDGCIHFYIAGDGKDRDLLHNIAKKKEVTDKVSFLGLVANPYPYIAHADLLVSSSRFEGFPNVVLEAGACGTPVVAFNCPGGTSEIIKDSFNGFLVENGHVDALAKHIQDALTHPFNKKDIQDYTSANYGLKKIIGEYEQTFESLQLSRKK